MGCAKHTLTRRECSQVTTVITGSVYARLAISLIPMREQSHSASLGVPVLGKNVRASDNFQSFPLSDTSSLVITGTGKIVLASDRANQ